MSNDTDRTYRYQCRECEAITRVELVPERRWDDTEYPPASVESICGQRDGGCGEVHELDLVEDARDADAGDRDD